MNTSKIKSYAIQARRDFLKAVTERANAYGIFSDDHIEPIDFKGDMAIIGERAFTKKEGELREKLVERVKRDGFTMVMRSCAYTWFNRFVALRYMEIHGYLEHGYKVLSSRAGSAIPEILENAADLEFHGLDKDKVIELKLAGTKDNELYRLLILAQCDDLHKSMPFLFDRIDNETELLLPDNLLHSDSPIRRLITEIDEPDWDDVEIIGWIYQFYISERKDEVIGKVIQSEDIPAATQLFTPNWIVKYMVHNTLGRMWLGTYPDSALRDKMEYYIEPAGQDPEVQVVLDRITPKELNPEEITFLDPACGSGHILVEAYDIFKEIYLERGYRTRDIPMLILEKNIFGLDICDRAAQLACFAVLMKSREDDRKILDREELKLNVMAIQETIPSDGRNIELFFKGDEYKIIKGDLNEIVSLFRKGKTFGSLITVPDHLVHRMDSVQKIVNDKIGKWITQSDAQNLTTLVKQTQVLARKYDCVVTNPPYMGTKGMNAKLKSFAKRNFPDSKSDLFAISAERFMGMVSDNRYIGVMTPFTWMFLSSYEKLREKILNQKTLASLIRPEYHAFFESAYVPICALTIFTSKMAEYKGCFIDLTQFYGAGLQAPNALKAIHNSSCEWRYNASTSDFRKIPGSPIAYWVRKAVFDLYKNCEFLNDWAEPKQGMATTDNNKYLRFWWEVSFSKIGFNFTSVKDAVGSNYKWFPYNKGGSFRKWFGNHEYIVNWQNDGEEIKEDVVRKYPYLNGNVGLVLKLTNPYFEKCLTWTATSSSYFGIRYSPPGFMFDVKGSSCFCDSKLLFSLLGFLASIITSELLKALNPTIEFQNGNLKNLPISHKFKDIQFLKETSYIVKELIEISKRDWNTLETAWGFSILPLLGFNQKMTFEESYTKLCETFNSNTIKMQQLEKKNNRIFIEAYGLEEELKPDVPISEISLTCNPYYRYPKDKKESDLDSLFMVDTIKQVISYAVGCMMGRYSLDHPGLIYAHSGNIDFEPLKYEKYPADDDGIIPIMDQEWFADDATNRFAEFLKVAWSPEILDENLKSVADSLKPKRNEASIETIRRYLSTAFFKDHLKTYKKRPIYWLFSSGKQKAFECLVYLHRYNESTLSRMRSTYVTPLQSNFSSRLEFLQGEKDAASTTSDKNKIQKEIDNLKKKRTELSNFDDELRHYADMKISLNLDDGVKNNYSKFGNLLAEKKAITGKR